MTEDTKRKEPKDIREAGWGDLNREMINLEIDLHKGTCRKDELDAGLDSEDTVKKVRRLDDLYGEINRRDEMLRNTYKLY